MAIAKLLITPRSPFARRIRFAMQRLNIHFQEEVVDIFKPSESFLKLNPLGQVPVLITEEQDVLSDSMAILEYLHDKSGGIWPQNLRQKSRVRMASVLVAGAMTACVVYYLENLRGLPADQWRQDQVDIVTDVLKRVQTELAAPDSRSIWIDQQGMLTQGSFDLGVTLEYIDLRMPFIRWRESFPALEHIRNLCQQQEGFSKTTPPAM